MKFYYGVQKGCHPGVYESWDACKKEVIGATGAIYKKFAAREEAEAFVQSEGYGHAVSAASSHRTAPAAPRVPDQATAPLFHAVTDVTKEDILAELTDVTTEALAYVDGSFNLTSGIYGYGGVLLSRDGSLTPLKGHGRDDTLRTMRNVAGEIHGAMAAIEAAAAAGIHSITIFYDYMGIEMWANGQWKTNKEGTRAYKAFIDDKRVSMDIQFQKVAAHTGVRFNELVDQLAKQAVGLRV